MSELEIRVADLERVVFEAFGTRLDREQVCQRIGKSPRTLHTMLNQRDFPRPVEGKWRLCDVVEWERLKAKN